MAVLQVTKVGAEEKGAVPESWMLRCGMGRAEADFQACGSG